MKSIPNVDTLAFVEKEDGSKGMKSKVVENDSNLYGTADEFTSEIKVFMVSNPSIIFKKNLFWFTNNSRRGDNEANNFKNGNSNSGKAKGEWYKV